MGASSAMAAQAGILQVDKFNQLIEAVVTILRGGFTR